MFKALIEEARALLSERTMKSGVPKVDRQNSFYGKAGHAMKTSSGADVRDSAGTSKRVRQARIDISKKQKPDLLKMKSDIMNR